MSRCRGLSRRRAWATLPAVLLGALVLAGCSGGDSSPAPAAGPEQTEPAPRAAPGDGEAAGEGLAFANDAELAAYVSPEALELPDRFVRVERSDREPILTLGLVSAAARVTYSSATTNEILSLDVLRLERDVDAEQFFSAFADSLTDERSFLGVQRVGVLRDIGELARHVRFTVEGDDGEAVAVLRNGLIALATYRRPAGLREVVDMGGLLARLDGSLRGAGGPAGDGAGGG